ncbi:MAG TPA: TIGR01777 family oxidoreductase [Gemmatimonadales bacterium]|nr:TIGR01777 family oxidoreductase [Gemmatimonadales bacterium]
MRSPFPVVERTSRLPASAEAVWAWHQRPGAFERLVPPWERVEIVQRSGGLADGGEVVAQVHAGPLTFRWVARHRDYQPGRQFVDEQVEGPFTQWVHTHRIVPDGPQSSFLTDRIEYATPYGVAGAAADLWIVRRKIERMLAYRHALLRDDLAAHARAALPPLHIAVTGASGLLGRALTAFLTTGGHCVTPLVRRAARAGEIQWDPAAGRLEPSALEGVDAVVHLAGENLAGGRWTAERKRRILASRAQGTALLARTLAGLARPPRVLVSASGVGIYGDRGDELLRDNAAPGPATDFLVQVVQAWESATEPARNAGIRVALPRFGAVLSPAGGALRKLVPVFQLGLGGRIGSGRQWMSWISIDDAVGLLHHAIATESLSGAFNGVAPVPVRNAEFAATLGRVLGRPARLPVPAAALRAVFGEMAQETVLASQRAVPDRAVQSGYIYRQPTLEQALRFVLGR